VYEEFYSQELQPGKFQKINVNFFPSCSNILKSIYENQRVEAHAGASGVDEKSIGTLQPPAYKDPFVVNPESAFSVELEGAGVDLVLLFENAL
jgi:hypothetical protein